MKRELFYAFSLSSFLHILPSFLLYYYFLRLVEEVAYINRLIYCRYIIVVSAVLSPTKNKQSKYLLLLCLFIKRPSHGALQLFKAHFFLFLQERDECLFRFFRNVSREVSTIGGTIVLFSS